METYKNEFPIKSMAKVLEVSRSNYYSSVKKEKKGLLKYDPQIVKLILTIWINSKKTYGLQRILKTVKESDNRYGARKIRRIMALLQISGKQIKNFRVATTDSKHNGRIAPDLVKRDFNPSEKNKIWVSDVTYIKSQYGWLYLCIVMDLYSRKIVGWEMSKNNDSRLVVNAIDKSIKGRNPAKGLIVHSDRGSNYCSNEVRKLLIANKIKRSNSRKGNCWDNACAESFFGSLKRELEFNVFYNLEDAKNEISEHIELFYNRQRKHSVLDYLSPQEYEDFFF